MASQPIDQGAILRSGMAVVPDLLAQQLQQGALAVQQQQAQAQMLSAQTAHAAQLREAQQLAAYQAAVASMGDHPTLSQHLQLMRMFPGEYSAAAGRAWEAQDKDQRDTDFSQMAQIHDALRNGHPELARQLLQTRHDADTAAGHPDPITEQMIAAIDSGDQNQIAQATEMARRTTAIMAGPERFAAIYGADEPHVQNVGPGDLALQSNAPGGPRILGQSPVPRTVQGINGSTYVVGPTPGVPLLNGGPIQTAPITPVPGTGPVQAPPSASAQPTSTTGLPGNGRSMPTGMFQGWTVIGVPGDPRRRPGGVEVPHNGVDFRPPNGNPHLVADRPLDVISTQPDHGISGITAIVRFPDGAEFNMMHLAAQPRPGHYDAGQVVATAGNTGNARGGSTQIHVQPWGGTNHDPRAYFGRGVGTVGSPVRVQTVQQARALPPGTPYVTPDNRSFVR